MKPIPFPEVNKTLNKPDSMTDEECGPLPIYSNGQECISRWGLTWKERLQVLVFGAVWLRLVSGHTQPPALIEARRTVFEKETA